MNKLGNIVSSMKYVAFNEENKCEKKREVFHNYNYIFKLQNLWMEFKDEIKLDDNNNPLSLENEFSKKFQLEYLTELFENVYKLSIKLNKSLIEALSEIQSNVLTNCIISLEFTNVIDILNKLEEPIKDCLKKFIRILGGRTNNTIINTTHFILSESKIRDFKENENIKLLKKKVLTVNFRWLFHCYFFYKRMDERDKEYKLLL